MNSGNTLQAVLFDVDGTLADTEQDGHRVAFNQAFKENGLNWQWSIELYGELLQITGGKERIRYYLERYSPELLSRNDLKDWIVHLHKTKTGFYEMFMEKGSIPLRPGVARLIHELRDKKIKLAIATTTTLENVTSLLKSTLGEESIDWFDVIGAGDIVSMKKPAPDIYHWVLDQLKLNARQCIAIEDSENGLKSAIAANLQTLITVNDYTHLQDFSGALAILSDLGEPEKPFIQINGKTFKQQWIDYQSLNHMLE
ncbi:haloacid dehalogenase superfamily, subfamily IA, variant 3 with third motif having DD or ED [Nitrosomonas sp. PY1]|uniref:HAD family hydrolase n=1 Tax=Nitrosomonas sp. PY1 TaxID=1803906 RepID=UPI001FC82200|nr:HAD family hydrolase [Nitrosomonas sp. PY1]GKS68470.1 haloacid dehalogenase superfamily, subfamily IA, variant 3 with third motif having DD or ED [Nitrosomonas sp. PY1]